MVVPVGSVAVANIDEGFAKQFAQNESVINDLLRDIAITVRDDAQKTAAFIDRTGNLRKSIGMRKSKFERGGYIVKATGRNRISGATRARGFHAHLVEFGHVKVLWGRRTGERVPPHPFMRPALERGRAYAEQRIRSLQQRG